MGNRVNRQRTDGIDNMVFTILELIKDYYLEHARVSDKSIRDGQPAENNGQFEEGKT